VQVFVGTTTYQKSEGIYGYRLNTVTGELTPTQVTTYRASPNFLAIHPNARYVYAVDEVFTDSGRKKSNGVVAFAMDPGTRALTQINRQELPGGPYHVSMHPSGQWVLAACYGAGSVALLSVMPDGSLGPVRDVVTHTGSGPHPTRQTAPHPHSVKPDKAGRFALVPDLGTDQVVVYRIDTQQGKLVPNGFAASAPGAGPRHVAFSPQGHHVYVINELHNTVTVFDYDPGLGHLRQVQTLSTLPASYTEPNTAADIHVHPSGKFVYGSNRGHDSIVIFAVDPRTGQLTLQGFESVQGKMPRNFGIDPSGQWMLVANQRSNNVTVFQIDARTGGLRFTGQQLAISQPVCVTFAQVG